MSQTNKIKITESILLRVQMGYRSISFLFLLFIFHSFSVVSQNDKSEDYLDVFKKLEIKLKKSSENFKNTQEKDDFYLEMAILLEQINFLEKANHYRLLISNDFQKNKISSFNNKQQIIINLMNMKKYDEGIEESNKFISNLLASKDTNNLIYIYNLKGIIYRNNNKNKEAISSFNDAKNLILIRGVNSKFDSSQYAFITGNIGVCHLNTGDYELAHKLLTEDLKVSVLNGEKSSILGAKLNLLKIYKFKKEYDFFTEKLYHEIEELSKELNWTKSLADLNEMYYSVNKITGNEKSIFYADELLRIKDSIQITQLNQDKKYVNAYNNLLFNIQQQKIIKINQQNFIYKVWLIVVVILVLTIAYLVKINISKFKKNNVRKLEQINSEKNLIEKNLEINKLKMNQIKKEFDFESRFTKRLAMELYNNKSSVERLLILIKEKFDFEKSKMKKISNLIKMELGINDMSNELTKDIEKLRIKCQSKLLFNNPKLTEKDIKLIFLVFLELSNKEIASIQNINPDSAKIAKKRLKKKMDLKPEDDLLVYIKEIIN